MHAFYQSALGTRLLCLCLSKCLATVDSATVICKRTVSNIANALPLHTHPVVLIVPRFLIKRLLLEMPERAKTVCICMHAHTNCKLVWQASYQSLLGGVLVNVSIFHERAGYTLVSAFHLLKLTTTHPASGRLLHAFLSECTWHETTVFMSQQLSGKCWLCNCILQTHCQQHTPMLCRCIHVL